MYELLKLRYSSRLWVVQELVLFLRVVMRIADIDFQSDGETSGSLWAPKFANSNFLFDDAMRGTKTKLADAQDHANVRESDETQNYDAHLVAELTCVWACQSPVPMDLTFSTACADPSDRLFGIMSIAANEQMAPDHTVSVQHGSPCARLWRFWTVLNPLLGPGLEYMGEMAARSHGRRQPANEEISGDNRKNHLSHPRMGKWYGRWLEEELAAPVLPKNGIGEPSVPEYDDFSVDAGTGALGAQDGSYLTLDSTPKLIEKRVADFWMG
ncbi:hypothetical protein N657DRAFT_674894 [Parathielavia appendiculata]|uniref:Heterokaryon incompatibility domain-containing protein n=1 Tax=Parathielavia appendiculata TaxID=2587402 RepID=A0AAN6TRQ6_9PEZI|nr:hypothetical protein N657DRAFT_674894 [Parathielavia appendiculata]